jgi:hypothetical protein
MGGSSSFAHSVVFSTLAAELLQRMNNEGLRLRMLIAPACSGDIASDGSTYCRPDTVAAQR